MACSKRLRTDLNPTATSGGTWTYLGYHPSDPLLIDISNTPLNNILITDSGTDNPLINPTNGSSGFYKWKYSVNATNGTCPATTTETTVEVKNTCPGGSWSLTRCNNSSDLIQLLPQFIINSTCGTVSSSSMTSSPSTTAFNSTNKTFLPSSATPGNYTITNTGTVIPSSGYAVNNPCDECSVNAQGTLNIIEYKSSGTLTSCVACACATFPGSLLSLRNCLSGAANGGIWSYTNNTGQDIRLSYVTDGSYLDIVPNNTTWTYQSPNNINTFDVRITGNGVAAPVGSYTFTYIQNQGQPCQNQQSVTVSLVPVANAGNPCSATALICLNCDYIASQFFTGTQTSGGTYTVSLPNTQTRQILVNGVSFSIGNGVTKVVNATDVIRFIQTALVNYRITYSVQSQGCTACVATSFVNISPQIPPASISANSPSVEISLGGSTYNLNSNFTLGFSPANVFYTIIYNGTTYTDPYPTGFSINNISQTGTFDPSAPGVVPGTYVIRRCHNQPSLNCFPIHCSSCQTQCAEYTLIVTGNCDVSISPSPVVNTCVGSSLTLTGTIPGSGTCTLQWESSLTGTSGWATIGGATSSTYNPSTASLGTTYYRLVRTCSAGCTNSTSNVTQVNIINPTVSITASQNNTCLNGLVTLNATTSNTSGCTLKWQSSPNGTSGWVDIAGQTNTSYIVPTSSLGTTYYRAVYNCSSLGGCTEIISNTQNIIVSTSRSVSIVASPSTNTGVGGIINMIPIPSGGIGTLGSGCTLQWQSGSTISGPWSDISGTTNLLLYNPPTSTVGTYYYRVYYTCPGGNGACSIAYATETITVTTQPSITISSSSLSNISCTNSTIVLTASTFNSSGTCTIGWQRRLVGDLSWSSVGSGTTHNVDTTTSGNYEYRASYTCSCVGCNVAYSNIITVNLFAQPAVSVLPENQSVTIGGTPSVFTATGTGGTGTCIYQWQLSSSPSGPWSNISGATNSTYLPSASTSGNFYYRVIYSCDGISCNSATSDDVLLQVTNSASVTISPTSYTTCQNGAAWLQAVTSGGSGTCTLQWQSSLNQSTWANISGATSVDYFPSVTNIGTTYYRVLYSCSSGDNATSNTSTITVLAQPSVTITPSPENVCVNANVIFTAQVSNGLSGCTYQWKSGPTVNSLTNILGATSSTYTPNTSSVGTTYYSVTYSCDSSNCPEVSSSVRSLTVVSPSSISITPTTVNACTGTSQLLTAVATGGTGTCGYQWQSSSNGGSSWDNIGGATSNTYSVPNTTIGNYLYRALYICTGTGCGQATSNTSTFTVSAPPSADIMGNNVVACINDTVTLTAVITGGNGNCNIIWESSNNNSTWNVIPGANSGTFNPPTVASGISYYRVRYECVGYTSCIAPTAVSPSKSVTITGCFQASIENTNQSVTYTKEIRSSVEGTVNRASIVAPVADTLYINISYDMLIYSNYPTSNTLIDTVNFNNNNNQLYLRIGYAGIILTNGGYITELKVYKSDDPNTSILVTLHNGTSFNYLSGFYGTITPAQLTFNSVSASTYRTALETQIKNALTAIPELSSSAFDLFVSATSGGDIRIFFTIKHTPSSSWIGINKNEPGRWVKYNANGGGTISETNGITFSAGSSPWLATYNNTTLMCNPGIFNTSLTPTPASFFNTTLSNFNFLSLNATCILTYSGGTNTSIETKKLLTVNTLNCTGTLSYLWTPGSDTTSTKLVCTGSGTYSCQVTCSDPNSQQTPQITV